MTAHSRSIDYPPPVAQYLSLFASVPSTLMLIAWGLAAAVGLLAAALAIARTVGSSTPLGPSPSERLAVQLRTVGLPVLAVAPFVFPFAIAILFGNLDAVFDLCVSADEAMAACQTARSAPRHHQEAENDRHIAIS